MSHEEKLLVQFHMYCIAVVATEQTLWSNYNLTCSNTYQFRKCQDVSIDLNQYILFFFGWSNIVQNAIWHRPDSGLCIHDSQRFTGSEKFYFPPFSCLTVSSEIFHSPFHFTDGFHISQEKNPNRSTLFLHNFHTTILALIHSINLRELLCLSFLEPV